MEKKREEVTLRWTKPEKQWQGYETYMSVFALLFHWTIGQFCSSFAPPFLTFAYQYTLSLPPSLLLLACLLKRLLRMRLLPVLQVLDALFLFV